MCFLAKYKCLTYRNVFLLAWTWTCLLFEILAGKLSYSLGPPYRPKAVHATLNSHFSEVDPFRCLHGTEHPFCVIFNKQP